MGKILMPAFAFRTALSEDAGVRSGIALTEADMLALLPEDHHLRDGLMTNSLLRVGSVDYADTVGDLLHAVGATDQPGMPSIGMHLQRLLEPDWRAFLELDQLVQLEAVANEYVRRRDRNSGDHAALLTELRQMAAGREEVWRALQEAMAFHLAFSPHLTRVVDAKSQIALTDLFTSERLTTDSGCFFDQRFINYLANQPAMLKNIHWRQFEALTAEWFQRQGYVVNLGPGRNDGSVDLRMWDPNAEGGAPPAIIVQCKRQERKVERVVVKALFSDVLHEQAAEGMIVTTSDISFGAAHDVTARAYPITTANRSKVQEWIQAMRKPNAGLIAGE